MVSWCTFFFWFDQVAFLKIINTFDFVQRCPLCVTFSAYVPCLILEAPDFLFLNLLRCSSVKTKMWSRWLWLRWSITLCVTYLLKFYFEVKHSERVTQRNKKRRKKVFINCLNIYIWNRANWNYTWPYITRHSYRTGLRWNKERPPYRRWPPKLPQFFNRHFSHCVSGMHSCRQLLAKQLNWQSTIRRKLVK